MNKLFALTCLGVVALAGYGIYNVQAQTSSATVGNPDSANVMIIQEGYEVVAPAGSNDMNGNAANVNWTQDGNAEVAPAPQDASAQVGNDNADGSVVETEDSLMQETTPDSETVIQTQESFSE